MMKKPIVLFVDDHKVMQETVRTCLENDGYGVITASNAKDMKKLLPRAEFNIILLDLMLPDGDGLTLISDIRQQTDVPIIIISSKGEMTDRVVGLEMGADDYISKPLPLRELSSRIKAQLRRYNGMKNSKQKEDANDGRLTFSRWTIDCDKAQVFDEKGRSCNLSAREFQLLHSLVKSPNRVLSREQILDKTRPEGLNVTDRAVDMQILRIRKKIGDTSDSDSVIQTVRGMGYMLAAVVKTVNR